jgi:hypothetical protein
MQKREIHEIEPTTSLPKVRTTLTTRLQLIQPSSATDTIYIARGKLLKPIFWKLRPKAQWTQRQNRHLVIFHLLSRDPTFIVITDPSLIAPPWKLKLIKQE